jgi:hypothetical protein
LWTLEFTVVSFCVNLCDKKFVDKNRCQKIKVPENFATTTAVKTHFNPPPHQNKLPHHQLRETNVPIISGD